MTTLIKAEGDINIELNLAGSINTPNVDESFNIGFKDIGTLILSHTWDIHKFPLDKITAIRLSRGYVKWEIISHNVIQIASDRVNISGLFWFQGTELELISNFSHYANIAISNEKITDGVYITDKPLSFEEHRAITDRSSTLWNCAVNPFRNAKQPDTEAMIQSNRERPSFYKNDLRNWQIWLDYLNSPYAEKEVRDIERAGAEIF